MFIIERTNIPVQKNLPIKVYRMYNVHIVVAQIEGLYFVGKRIMGAPKLMLVFCVETNYWSTGWRVVFVSCRNQVFVHRVLWLILVSLAVSTTSQLMYLQSVQTFLESCHQFMCQH